MQTVPKLEHRVLRSKTFWRIFSLVRTASSKLEEMRQIYHFRLKFNYSSQCLPNFKSELFSLAMKLIWKRLINGNQFIFLAHIRCILLQVAVARSWKAAALKRCKMLPHTNCQKSGCLKMQIIPVWCGRLFVIRCATVNVSSSTSPISGSWWMVEWIGC